MRAGDQKVNILLEWPYVSVRSAFFICCELPVCHIRNNVHDAINRIMNNVQLRHNAINCIMNNVQLSHNAINQSEF